MLFKLTWTGAAPHTRHGLTFQPGESKFFESLEHIPQDVQDDAGFEIAETSDDEARGVIGRFEIDPGPDGPGGGDSG